ncbi:hypothetical protein BSPWISOXPB_1001 [uncultured Gammaproteobacteria bacterium]|nr:hypothetical protein BSPWISOXPB_1001 [uncultured Gammaproteobacteria bacterium]
MNLVYMQLHFYLVHLLFEYGNLYFFTGGSVWNPIAWGAATKSLVEDNSNKNKLIRKISFIFILIIDILIIYGIYKQSWIFN